jgi:hypothetical protein
MATAEAGFSIPAAILSTQNSQMAMVLAAQLQAEIQAAVIMAERSPRDWDIVREKVLKECKRPSFAAVARYNKPIGKGVQGWSIRFAEAAIQAAKHIHTTTRTIWEDDEQRKILIKVWDAQEGVSYADEVSIEKTVERRSVDKETEVIRTRKNSKGDLLYIIRATEDDLLNKVGAAKSKSIRNSGLRLIPGWILDQAFQEVKATLKDEDAANPDAAKQKLFDAFGELGVDVASIKKFLGHDVANLSPAELMSLRGLYAELRDGQTTMFEVLTQIEREKEQRRDQEREATAGPVGTVSSAPGSAVQSVRDKILARGRKLQEEKPSSAPDPGAAGTAGGPTPTPQTDPKQ